MLGISLRPSCVHPFGVLFFTALLALISNAQAQNTQHEPPKGLPKDVSGKLLEKRMDWFYQQRAYPHKTIPAGARFRAMQEFENQLAAEKAARQRGGTFDQVGAWQLLGPAILNGFWGVNSGRVTAIAVDPTNSNIVYLGAAQGGVWKTTDGGSTWTPLTDTQASLATGSIAIDPQNHLTVYVGTGELNNSGDSYYGAGILKSTDGGSTWTNIPGSFAGGSGGGARIGGIAVQPGHSSVLLAAVGCCGIGSWGVYRSADAGLTWTQTLTVNGNQAYNVHFDTNTPNTAYASLDSNGVYVSNDGGLTWVPANGSGSAALPSSGFGRVELAMDPNATKTLWVALSDNNTSGLLGLYRTTDGGNTWTQIPSAPDFCAGQCWYDIAIAVQPGNSNVVVLGGSEYNGQVVVSTDGGSTWTLYNDLHPDTHSLVFSADGSVFYTGDDGGIWSTTNLTSVSPTWTSLNAGLSTLQFYPGLSIDSADINTMLAGTQDNTTELYSGSTTWKDVTCGDGGATAIDSTTTPPTMYSNCILISLVKSTDGGNTWPSATNGLNPGDRANWTPPLTMDPSNPQRIYFGTQFVYQTTDGAGTWTAISPDLTNGGNGAALSAIAVSPVDPNTLWTASGDARISITHNALSGASASWSNVTGTNMLPNRYPTAVAADPVNASTAYLVFSGFSGYGDNFGHVFSSQDGGSTWTDISGNLPNIPVNDIAIDPAQANTYYVGTDFGVFYTTNGGTAWSTLVTGLPRVAVLSLKVDAGSRNLRAATHGRSVWGTNLSSITPIPAVISLSPASALVGSAALTLTVNGGAFTPTAIVQWNGADLATTYISSTQLTATIPASDLTVAGSANVGVIIPGGNNSNTLPFAINNRLPGVTSISPPSAIVGGPGFTLTVTGSNFISTSTVLWNGGSLTTTFVNATSLKASVPASDIAATGTIPVAVSSPAPGGGTSGSVSFTINNPVPVATTLSPTSRTAGTSAFTLTVTGSNFVSASKIFWKSTALTTTFVNATQLTASVPAANIATPGTAHVSVFNPTPGGGVSGLLTFTISNPVPTETRLSPAQTVAGGVDFTLTVTGTNFETNSVVQWNGSNRTTTYVSSTSITATITAADIALAGTGKVSVNTPAPGGGTSGNVIFTINNPVPTITSLSPTSVIASSGAFTLTVTGTNFVTSSIVQWAGSNRATTYVSPTQVTASILAGDIATAGRVAVTVFNPAPGGGTSRRMNFIVNNPVPVAVALSPSSAILGGPTFTLTVTGQSFASGAKVYWRGTALTTTFVNSGKVTASVPASNLATVGNYSVSVLNSGPGGGLSNALSFTVDNPVPSLTSLSPSNATAGGASFTLTVNGTKFVSGASILWGNISLHATFVSSTQLTATVSATHIASGGTVAVSVSNPTPGGGVSGSRTFTVNNPVPVINILSPGSAAHGGAAFTLTVFGTGFQTTSNVLWNGSARAATYLTAGKLTASITATDIAAPGTANVTVSNPAPGGGTSAPATFTIR
jgi:photosystem II stability/assembly factor-like uncharacterized protein